MKLIYEPTVYLVGKQHTCNHELNQFLNDEGAPEWVTDAESAAEKLPEVAGRLCYMSYAKPRPGGNLAYLDHILDVGHGSVLEHATWNLIFTGISRSLSHELVRHRVGWGYSQLSQRYVDESVAEYVVPPDMQEEVKAAQAYIATTRQVTATGCLEFCPQPEDAAVYFGMRWLRSIEHSHADYGNQVYHLTNKAAARGLTGTEAKKFARQAARSVLPNATETKIFVTVNARAARHFLHLRGSRHADAEIRQLAIKLWEVLKADAPNLFADFSTAPLPDGSLELTTSKGFA